MAKHLFIILLLICMGGCAMPKHLEYNMDVKAINSELAVIDNRPDEEKHFSERIDSDVSYFYGDDSFDIPLTEILKNRLASKFPTSRRNAKITINKIILAASINGGSGRINENAYGVASTPGVAGPGAEPIVGAALARPLLSVIEQGSSRRSIWCRIDYTINGEEFSERTVNSAKFNQLKEGIVQLYLQTIDNIGEKSFQNR